MIDQLRHDLRYAIRTLLAAITIAVGIGANTAIFSVVNAVLLRPLPFPNPDALVVVAQTDRQTGRSSGDATPANFLDWRARNRSVAGLSGYRNAGYALSTGDHPERIAGAIVNSTFFDVLGIQPAMGRAFGPADEGPGAARVAMISRAVEAAFCQPFRHRRPGSA